MKLMMRVTVKLSWIPVIGQKREINTKEKWLTTWFKRCSPRRQFDVLREKIDL